MPGAAPRKLTGRGQAVKPSELPQSGREYIVRRCARSNDSEMI
jgi:hypothetical protein